MFVFLLLRKAYHEMRSTKDIYNFVFDLLLFKIHLRRMHRKQVIKSDFIDDFINIYDEACAGK